MDTRDTVSAIYELQDYLRELYSAGVISTSVIPDGVFDNQTEQAVKEFQRSVSLPESGVVDYLTWTALEESARNLKNARQKSLGIFPFERSLSGNMLSPNEQSDLVLLIQLMLKELSAYDYEQIELNGIYDRATVDAIRDFQRVNYLPDSGFIDKDTWNALARAYNKYISSLTLG